jgi:hypothetical protein
MNKFVQYNDTIYEIRPNREFDVFAALDPFELSKCLWTDDFPIGDPDSWEKLIENGLAEVIDIEQFIEKNFEKLI